MAEDPLIIYLPFSLVEEFNLARIIANDGRWSWSEGYALLKVFSLASHEKRFARELLRRRRNIWLFRTNQRRFCGDFITVDMSAATLTFRKVHVIELKTGEAVSHPPGGGQLQNSRLALEEIALRHGIIEPDCEATLIKGGEEAVLDFLGAPIL